jgi:hypothetical protein
VASSCCARVGYLPLSRGGVGQPMPLLGHALAVGFDFEIKISFHVTSARPP